MKQRCAALGLLLVFSGCRCGERDGGGGGKAAPSDASPPSDAASAVDSAAQPSVRPTPKPPADAAPATPVVTGLGKPAAIATDGKSLYVADVETGEIVKVP